MNTWKTRPSEATRTGSEKIDTTGSGVGGEFSAPRAVPATHATRVRGGDGAAAPCLPYGRNWPGLDLWCDRDGSVYSGDGPYTNRPWRVLRRKANRWLVRRGWSR